MSILKLYLIFANQDSLFRNHRNNNACSLVISLRSPIILESVCEALQRFNCLGFALAASIMTVPGYIYTRTENPESIRLSNKIDKMQKALIELRSLPPSSVTDVRIGVIERLLSIEYKELGVRYSFQKVPYTIPSWISQNFGYSLPMDISRL